MAAPTVYKWTDASAPQILRGDVPSHLALFQAVLVNGYGAKPAAGWTIPFSDATSFVIKQGGTRTVKACLKFHTYNAAGYGSEFETADDYTDLTTPVNQWAGGASNEKIGSQGYASVPATYNIPWVIFATARSMWCFWGYNNIATDVTQFVTNFTSTVTNMTGMFFGDYKAYEPSFDYNQGVYYSIATSYSSVNMGTSISSLYYLTTSRKKASRSWNLTTGGKSLVPLSTGYYNRSQTMGHLLAAELYPSYPSLIDGGLYLDKVRLMVDSQIMGEAPGQLYSPMTRPFPFNGEFWSFAGSGDYSGENIYVVNTNNGQFYLTDGDWGVE